MAEYDFAAAAEAAKSLANQFRALLKVGDALGEMASFQNMRRELVEAKDKAEADLKPVVENLIAARYELDFLRGQKEAHEEKIARRTKETEEYCAEQISKMVDEGKEILDNAHKAAEGVLRASQDEKARHEEDMAVKYEEMTAVATELYELKAELDSIRSRFIVQ